MSKENTHENSDSRIASLKIQDREYNQMYRKWRIDHKDDYGFYFTDKSDEFTYRNGEGFINEYPEAEEYGAVSGTNTAAGITLIIYTAINILVPALLTFLSPALGLDVSYNSAGYFTGNETTALILLYATNIIERIVPIFFLMNVLKIPIKLVIPLKIKNMPLFKASIPMTMMVYGIVTSFCGFEYLWFYMFGLDSANYIWIPENKFYFFLSVLLNIIILPIMTEVILRGIFMTVFRQFGDAYALIITSVISALVTGNISYFLYSFTVALVIGYFTIRTGSVLTAIIMKIIFMGSSYGLTYLKSIEALENHYFLIYMFIVFFYMAFGIIMVILFMKKHSNKINLPLYNMYMGLRDKLLCFAANPAVLIWLGLIVIYTAMSMRVQI